MVADNSFSDKELLDLLSQDNVQAFDTIYARYWEDLYKTAYVILKDTDASKDIVQDIFVWLWQNRKQLNIQFLKTYLKVAVKFKVANFIRSGNIRESFFEQLSNYSNAVSLPAYEEKTELKEFNTIITQAIAHLPDKCRNIFRLSRESNLSNQQIAEKLGISVKTVENQMTIALSRIRSAIRQYVVIIFLFIITIFSS